MFLLLMTISAKSVTLAELPQCHLVAITVTKTWWEYQKIPEIRLNSKPWKSDSIRSSSITMKGIQIWKLNWWSGWTNCKILSWRKYPKSITLSWSLPISLDSRKLSKKSEDSKKSSLIKSIVLRQSTEKETIQNLWLLRTQKTNKKWLFFLWNWSD